MAAPGCCCCSTIPQRGEPPATAHQMPPQHIAVKTKRHSVCAWPDRESPLAVRAFPAPEHKYIRSTSWTTALGRYSVPHGGERFVSRQTSDSCENRQQPDGWCFVLLPLFRGNRLRVPLLVPMPPFSCPCLLMVPFVWELDELFGRGCNNVRSEGALISCLGRCPIVDSKTCGFSTSHRFLFS